MKNQNSTVAILLSTFNAEKYLQEQIESIIQQTYSNWVLYIRDDGSSDSTRKLIEKFLLRDKRIKLIDANSSENLGVIKSFFKLLHSTSADFYMFCDQDDFWLPNKVEITLGNMQEQNYCEIPILVHTDLEVVDKNLHLISSSFIAKQHLKGYLPLEQLIVQNNVTGCTVMINQQLKAKLDVVPNQIIMHDWWMALIAETFGKLVFVNEPTILYRQHGNNVVGSNSIFSKIKQGYNYNKVVQSLDDVSKQDSAFLTMFDHQLSPQQSKLFSFGANMFTIPRIKRLCLLERYGIKKTGLVRNILFKLVTFLN